MQEKKSAHACVDEVIQQSDCRVPILRLAGHNAHERLIPGRDRPIAVSQKRGARDRYGAPRQAEVHTLCEWDASVIVRTDRYQSETSRNERSVYGRRERFVHD